ncbi:MAG: hypothetical protein ABFD49_01365 [Armatimonadota bacterium]|nr:hypothetical protein [bacterium]
MHQAIKDKQLSNYLLDELKEHADELISVLRWLWTLNLAASIASILVHQYVYSAIAGVSFAACLYGAAVAGRAKRALEDAAAPYKDDMK